MFKTKIYRKKNLLYLPKEIIELIDEDEVELIPDEATVLMIRKDEDLKKVLRSLELIKGHLEMRLERLEEKKKEGGLNE